MEMPKKRAGEVHKCHGLIPGLPCELAIECLVKVPYQFQSDMKCVCRSWRSLLSHSSFTKERRRNGKAELLLCIVQPLTPPKTASKEVGDTLKEVEDESQQPRVFETPRFGLSVYNATIATWNRVAFPKHQIPLFCECVAIQDAGKILLIGGWDPETLQPVKDVYVLELTGRRWRRGAPMKESRSFFACASVASKVYVAGGHDDQKNALRSAEVYDVERDEWLTLPPMREGRDECQGLAVETETEKGFYVLSGYGTESQGRFRSDGEVYDPLTNSWSKIDKVWPFSDTSPRGRVAGDVRGSSKLWCFTESELQVPMTGSSVYAGSYGGEAVVMIGGGSEGVMMKKNGGKWSRVHDIPYGFSTLPFSHASIYV